MEGKKKQNKKKELLRVSFMLSDFDFKHHFGSFCVMLWFVKLSDFWSSLQDFFDVIRCHFAGWCKNSVFL